MVETELNTDGKSLDDIEIEFLDDGERCFKVRVRNRRIQHALATDSPVNGFIEEEISWER